MKYILFGTKNGYPTNNTNLISHIPHHFSNFCQSVLVKYVHDKKTQLLLYNHNQSISDTITQPRNIKYANVTSNVN